MAVAVALEKVLAPKMKLRDLYDRTEHLYDQAMRELTNALTWSAQLDDQKLIKTLWIDQITFRRKTFRSLLEKCVRKNLLASPEQDISPGKILSEIYDIAGVRVICVYADLVPNIVRTLERNPQVKIIQKKNYNLHSERKPNGYRGFHIQACVKVSTGEQEVLVPVEIQIRTCLQHVWAVAEHAVLYKPTGELNKFKEIVLGNFFKWLSKQIVVLDSGLIVARECAKVNKSFDAKSILSRLERKFTDLKKVQKKVKLEVIKIFEKVS